MICLPVCTAFHITHLRLINLSLIQSLIHQSPQRSGLIHSAQTRFLTSKIIRLRSLDIPVSMITPPGGLRRSYNACAAARHSMTTFIPFDNCQSLIGLNSKEKNACLHVDRVVELGEIWIMEAQSHDAMKSGNLVLF